jgi:hypothetical protein
MDLNQFAIGLLNPVDGTAGVNVSFGVDGQTTLYTVPIGKRAVIFAVAIVPGADAGTTTVSIGQVGALTDFVPVNTLSNLDAQYDVIWLMPIPNTTPLKGKSYAAGTVIQADVGAHAGGTTNAFFVFGFLY